MSSCGPSAALVGGAPVGGGFPSTLIAGPIVTTDATVQTAVIANFPVVGGGVYYRAVLRGQQTNGQRGFRADFWCDASRNAIGTNGLQTGNIGPTGYTDAALAPWNTVGVPAGWAVNTLNIVGNQIQVQWNGAAGQTVEWWLVAERIFLSGATP